MGSNIASVAVGDTNLGTRDLRALAKDAGAQLQIGHKIDSAFFTGPVSAITSQVLAMHGSDHHAVLFQFMVRGYPVVLLNWNTKVGRPPSEVRAHVTKLVKRYRPQVVTLQETNTYGVALSHVPGYSQHQGPSTQETGRTESAEVCTLIRHDMSVRVDRVMRMTKSWKGPKHGLHHDPREFRINRLILPNKVRLRVENLHFATDGPNGVNAAAVQENIDRTVRWL